MIAYLTREEILMKQQGKKGRGKSSRSSSGSRGSTQKSSKAESPSIVPFEEGEIVSFRTDYDQVFPAVVIKRRNSGMAYDIGAFTLSGFMVYTKVQREDTGDVPNRVFPKN